MFSGLSTELMGAAIYDLGRAIINKASKNEWVQLTLKKWDLKGEQHDFAMRYLEALVEFRFMDKESVVMLFFREESIAQIFFNYYYGDATKKGKESQLWASIEHCVEALKVGDDVKAHQVDVEAEIKQFWEVFKQKVNESRTVKEVEVEQTLDKLRLQGNSILEMLDLFQDLMKLQGKTQIQVADKIYNIDKIDTAFFGQLLNKPPRFLTTHPHNTTYFIGRENDLAAIERNYQENNRLLVLVNGQGGMGKTTLAAKYWVQHEDRYKHLAWIFADNGIGNALLSLAANLGIKPNPTDDIATQIARIREGINNLEMPCLLVFDNANDKEDLEAYYDTLHKFNKSCHILLTTRVSELGDMLVHPVLPLDKDDAKSLFKKHYPGHSDKEESLLESLLNAVGYNTLVIEVLAKNLAVFNHYDTAYRLETLVADLKNKGLFAIQNKKVGVHYQSDTLRQETPEKIIEQMYDLSKLGAEEKYLLSNFAVLPAENIPFDLFKDLIKPENPAHFKEALRSLEQKGWIEYQQTNKDFKISPVIQAIVLKKNPNILADCKSLIAVLKNGLNNRDVTHKDNFSLASRYVSFGEAVINAIGTADNDLAILCQYIGNFHSDTGNLSLMMIAYQKMVDILSALCAKEPDNQYFKNGLANSYEKLGSAHTALGNLEKALGFYKERNRLGIKLYAAYTDNVDFEKGLAISYQYLGITHTALGNMDKSLGFYEDYYRMIRKLHADNPNNVDFKNGLAISYSKLGETHTALGNLDKALGFYLDYYSTIRKLHADNPNNMDFKNGLAISYSKLGETHTALGNLDKALGFYEEFNRLEKELHADHPNNVSFKNGLAVSYQFLGITLTALGNLDKVLGYYEEFNRLEKELYDDYPNIVEFKNQLAISYSKLGEFSIVNLNDKPKARAYFNQAETLFQELVRDAPQYVEYQRFLEMIQKALKILD
jgi:tetratricopeptide (TPR) repeat protein